MYSMQKAEKMQALREFAAEIRVETLKTIGSLGFGHVGGSMSIADAMAVLYGDIMKIDPKNPRWEDLVCSVQGTCRPVCICNTGTEGLLSAGRDPYPEQAGYQLPVSYRPHQDSGR